MMGSIDKQATIDAIYEKANEELADVNHHFLAGVHMATAVVRDMPELDVPDRKVGKWIPVTNGRGGHECKLCHTYAPSFQTGDEWLTDYCGNCGARMEGE